MLAFALCFVDYFHASNDAFVAQANIQAGQDASEFTSNVTPRSIYADRNTGEKSYFAGAVGGVKRKSPFYLGNQSSLPELPPMILA